MVHVTVHKRWIPAKNPKGYVPVVELMDSFFMWLMCGGLTLPFSSRHLHSNSAGSSCSCTICVQAVGSTKHSPTTRQQEALVLECSSNCCPSTIFFSPSQQFTRGFPAISTRSAWLMKFPFFKTSDLADSINPAASTSWQARLNRAPKRSPIVCWVQTSSWVWDSNEKHFFKPSRCFR